MTTKNNLTLDNSSEKREQGFKHCDTSVFEGSTPASYLLLHISGLDLKPQLDSLPVLLCGINGKAAATKAKEYLGQFFSHDIPVWFYAKDKSFGTTLQQLDSCDCAGEDCRALIVPQPGFDKKVYTFGDLIRILERLTGEDGCPWDKQQTHQSIRSNMIEEAYEAAIAIGNSDKDNLIEELGDVLLQSVFHADIARRGGEFALSDVISALCRKLFTRHTHIFGAKKAENSGEALKNWEDAKAAEKGKDAGLKDFGGLPSLMRAQKISKKLSGSQIKDKPETIKKDAQIKTKDERINEKNFLFKADRDADFGRFLYESAKICSDFGKDAETELNAYLDKLVKQHKFCVSYKVKEAEEKTISEKEAIDLVEYWINSGLIIKWLSDPEMIEAEAKITAWLESGQITAPPNPATEVMRQYKKGATKKEMAKAIEKTSYTQIETACRRIQISAKTVIIKRAKKKSMPKENK